MILIAHRGNINGKNINLENSPNYIQKAIDLGYQVEIDLWNINNDLYLGHDIPQYKISNEWIKKRQKKLWIHCKNIESLSYMKNVKYDINYFWHQNDDFTLTNKNFIWTYPGKKLTKFSIAVLPEINNDNISLCYGICSDFIEKYK